MAEELQEYKMSVRKALLDPRTKLLLLVLLALFCLAGVGGAKLAPFRAALAALPFVLMFVDKRTIRGFVLLKKLVERGRTVIVVTHDTELIEAVADYLLVL